MYERGHFVTHLRSIRHSFEINCPVLLQLCRLPVMLYLTGLRRSRLFSRANTEGSPKSVQVRSDSSRISTTRNARRPSAYDTTGACTIRLAEKVAALTSSTALLVLVDGCVSRYMHSRYDDLATLSNQVMLRFGLPVAIQSPFGWMLLSCPTCSNPRHVLWSQLTRSLTSIAISSSRAV